MASNMSDHSNQRMDKSRTTNNVINLTTSETLRLDGDRTNLHLQAEGGGVTPGFQKKKNSSFQITSITSRLSNDGGEDSADDTEDISDIMDSSKGPDFDQETPSFSEDYSKSEEVFFGPAPVIPTSSQYGITALVQQTGSGGVMTARLPQGVTVNVTEGGIALAKADGESDDVDHWQNRFKIVKIDSNEPFKRGRWICLDFMDSPAVSAANSQKKDDSNVVVNSVGQKEPDVGDNQPQTVVQLTVPLQQQTHTGQAQSHSVPAQYQVPHSSQASTPMVPSQPAQSSGVPMQSTQHISGSAAPQAQSTLQYTPQGAQMQGQLQPPMSQGYQTTSQTPQGSVHPSPSAQTPPQAQTTLQQPQMQQSSLPPQTLQQSTASQPNVQPTMQAPKTSLQPGAVSQATMQQGMVPGSSHAQQQQHQPGQPQSSMPQPSMNTQSIPQQGIPGQNVTIPQSVPQTTVMGQPGIPTQSLQPTVISSLPTQGVSMGQPVVTHPGVPPQPVMSQPQQGVAQQTHPPQSVPPQTLGQSPVVQSGPSPQQINQGLTSKTIPGAQQMQVPSSQQMPTTQMSSNIGQAGIINQATMGTPQQITAGAPQPSVQTSQAPPVSHGSHPGTGAAPTPATTPAQPQSHLSMGASGVQPTSVDQPPQQQQPQPPTNLDGIPAVQPTDDASNATPPAPGQPDDSESASTASTVAIDNKIEQAMDLVKSHLMFAVREEVEVLKEKITELMERINQLEYENTVLRQYATQEALQQIQQPHHNSNT
ncbi:TSC22 domain family protein 2-like isoform X2 [Penaeus chinensis]|uniref:TSC22 domain family protein 2-like isoform X2 n=1 Tax=Penaeus chinensis TaxID=139456 RepID=UPI001FB5BA2D|nr:TSC22 domain family protein 2-like isoform X2 [Penaeus chinensis]